MKFHSKCIVFNLLDVILEKLNSAKTQTFSVDMKKVANSLEMLESYQQYVSDVMNKHYIYKNNFKTNVFLNNNHEQKDVWIKNNKQGIVNEQNDKWVKNNKQDIITIVNNKDNQNFNKDFNAKNDVPLLNNNYGKKDLWIKNNKQDVTVVKNKDTTNWRTLKPDNIPKTHIFSRGNQKPIHNDMKDSQKNKLY